MSDKSQDIVTRIIDLYAQGAVPASVMDDFLVWLASDVHTEAKDRALMEIWNSIDKKPTLRTRKALVKLQSAIRPKSVVKKMTLRKTWLRVAAVLLPAAIVVGAAYTLLLSPKAVTEEAFEPTVFTTQAGVDREYTLPDGTIVWMEGGSKLTYSESKQGERIADMDGNIYFTVARDELKPFVVNTEQLSVEVLGTIFDIDAVAGSELTHVALDKGSVMAKVGDRSIVMKPGERLSYNASTGELDLQTGAAATGSRRTKLMFDNMAMPQIFDKLERFYGVTISTDRPVEERERYSTRFTGGDNLDDILEVLELLTGSFSYRIEGDTVKINMN